MTWVGFMVTITFQYHTTWNSRIHIQKKLCLGVAMVWLRLRMYWREVKQVAEGIFSAKIYILISARKHMSDRHILLVLLESAKVLLTSTQARSQVEAMKPGLQHKIGNLTLFSP